MGNKITVSVKNIILGEEDLAQLKATLYDLVVVEERGIFVNKNLSIYNTDSYLTNNGIEWCGKITYYRQQGQFVIRKVNRLKACCT